MSHYVQSNCYRYVVFSQRWTETKFVYDKRPKLTPKEFAALLDKKFSHTEDKLKWHLFDLCMSQVVIRDNPRKCLVPWPLNKDITPGSAVIVKAMPTWITKRRVIATEREWNERYDTFVFEKEPTAGAVRDFDESMTEDEKIMKMAEDTSIPTVRVGFSTISFNDSLNLPDSKTYICDKCKQRGHLIGECPMFPDLERDCTLEIEADDTYPHIGYIRKKASGEPLKGVPRDQYMVNKATQGFGYISSSYVPTTHFDCEMCCTFSKLPCPNVTPVGDERMVYSRVRTVESRIKDMFDFVLDVRCATFRPCNDNIVAYLKVDEKRFIAFANKLDITNPDDKEQNWGSDRLRLRLLMKMNEAMEKEATRNKATVLTNALREIEAQQKEDRGEHTEVISEKSANETTTIKLFDVAVEITPTKRNQRQSKYIDDKLWPPIVAPFVSGCCKTRMCRRCWIVSGLYRDTSVCYNCGTKTYK